MKSADPDATILPKTLKLLQAAVVMRVHGMTWAQIAPKMRRKNEDSARKIQTEYPETWKREYGAALEKYHDEMESEASLVMRELLRPIGPVYDTRGRPAVDGEGQPVMQQRDEKVRQSAAHSLLNHARQSRVQKLNIEADIEHGFKSTTELILKARNGGFGHGGESGDAETEASKPTPPVEYIDKGYNTTGKPAPPGSGHTNQEDK